MRKRPRQNRRRSSSTIVRDRRGIGENGDRGNALQAGFTAFLTKPVKPAELLEACRSLVRRATDGRLSAAKLLEKRGIQVGPVPLLEDVVEFGELPLDLLEARLVANEQQDATGGAVVERDTSDCVEVEGAAGEKPRDVRHRARVVAHAKLKHHPGIRRKSVT
jgi:hypothetical protein